MSLTNYCFPSSYINCVHLIFSYLQTVYTNFHLYNASSNRGAVHFSFYFSFEWKPWGKPAVFDHAPLWCKQMFKLCSGRMSETHVHEWCRICPPSLAALFIATTVFTCHAVMREKVRRKQPQALCLSTAKFALVLCSIFCSSMLCFIHLSIDQIKVLSQPWAPGTQISTALYSTGSCTLQWCGCKILPEENNEPISVLPYSMFAPLTYVLLLVLPVCKSKPAYIYTQKRPDHKFCFPPARLFMFGFSLSELLFVLLATQGCVWIRMVCSVQGWGVVIRLRRVLAIGSHSPGDDVQHLAAAG